MTLLSRQGRRTSMSNAMLKKPSIMEKPWHIEGCKPHMPVALLQQVTVSCSIDLPLATRRLTKQPGGYLKRVNSNCFAHLPRDIFKDSMAESNFRTIFDLIIDALMRPWEKYAVTLKYTEVRYELKSGYQSTDSTSCSWVLSASIMTSDP